jgi:hypothetical protein
LSAKPVPTFAGIVPTENRNRLKQGHGFRGRRRFDFADGFSDRSVFSAIRPWCVHYRQVADAILQNHDVRTDIFC